MKDTISGSNEGISNDKQAPPNSNLNLETIPIIRYEKCGTIPMISCNLNKNQIKIYCPKEKKETNVSIDIFFENIEKLKNFNLCENCRPESSNINSKEIYICKNCSNKKLCKNCADNHNLKDEIIKIDKFDST